MTKESRESMEIIREALGVHHPAISLACSFQVEDLVILDMMHRINPESRVFALDTGRLGHETGVALHPESRNSLQPPVRPGLPADRVRLLHHDGHAP